MQCFGPACTISTTHLAVARTQRYAAALVCDAAERQACMPPSSKVAAPHLGSCQQQHSNGSPLATPPRCSCCPQPHAICRRLASQNCCRPARAAACSSVPGCWLQPYSGAGACRLRLTPTPTPTAACWPLIIHKPWPVVCFLNPVCCQVVGFDSEAQRKRFAHGWLVSRWRAWQQSQLPSPVTHCLSQHAPHNTAASAGCCCSVSPHTRTHSLQ